MQVEIINLAKSFKKYHCFCTACYVHKLKIGLSGLPPKEILIWTTLNPTLTKKNSNVMEYDHFHNPKCNEFNTAPGPRHCRMLEKKKYCRLLQMLLQDEGTIMDFLKKTRMKDIIYLLAGSWAEIKADTLKRIPQEEIDFKSTDKDDLPLAQLLKNLSGTENANEKEVSGWMASDEV
ncbi:hypothetical protein PR048_023918 [Dryococelus australis]|uniref:Uncharacterized protein n=1 Tax=Dryococelus australis TaxID=614101 RepID=A0ABQ9GVE2_9NEOP|nr:hypothetical protein PR048_023918 [Dryococelus australis]